MSTPPPRELTPPPADEVDHPAFNHDLDKATQEAAKATQEADEREQEELRVLHDQDPSSVEYQERMKAWEGKRKRVHEDDDDEERPWKPKRSKTSHRDEAERWQPEEEVEESPESRRAGSIRAAIESTPKRKADQADLKLTTIDLTVQMTFYKLMAANHLKDANLPTKAQFPVRPPAPQGYVDWHDDAQKKFRDAALQNTRAGRKFPSTPRKYQAYEKALIKFVEDTDRLLERTTRQLDDALEKWDSIKNTLTSEQRRTYEEEQFNAGISNDWLKYVPSRRPPLPSGVPVAALPGGSLDPAAPPLRRDWAVKAFTIFPVAKSDETVLVVSNVYYLPDFPPDALPTRRLDGRFGPHEESRFPQWHQWNRWHMAFVPTLRNGLVSELQHSSLRKDMVWYEINWEDFQTQHSGHGAALRPRRKLAQSLEKTWDKTFQEWQLCRKVTSTIPGAPHSAALRAEKALNYLLKHDLPERDIIETLAAWQRDVQEMRGWLNFVRCRAQLAETASRHRMADTDHVLMPFRGVFTYEQSVAARIAQFNVPVWYVKEWTKTHDTRYAWKQLVPQPHSYENRSWNDDLGPSYLRSAYEFAPAPTSRANEDYSFADNDFGGGSYERAPAPTSRANEDYSFADNDFGGGSYERAPSLAPVAPFASDASGGSYARAPSITPVASLPSNASAAAQPPSQIAAPSAQPQPAAPKKGKKKNQAIGAKNPLSFNWNDTGAGVPDWYVGGWSTVVGYLEAPELEYTKERANWLADSSTPMAVPQRLRTKPLLLRVPPPQQLANAQSEGITSAQLAVLCDLIGPWATVLASYPVAEVEGFAAKEWKEILKGYVRSKDFESFAQRLGIANRIIREDVSMSTDIVDNKDPSLAIDLTRLARRAERPESLASSPHMSATTMPSTAATSRATSPALRGIGNDDEEVHTDFIPGEDCPLDYEPSLAYYHPFPRDGERKLAAEEMRYLYEPDGWRWKGVGQARGKRDFTWFVEADREHDSNDGMPEFMLIGGRSKNADFSNVSKVYDAWWCYDKGWGFLFQHWVDPAKKHAAGERLVRLRKFEMDGGRNRKYAAKPMTLRIWHERPEHDRLWIASDPVGAVGSATLATCTGYVRDKFYLKGDLVLKLFPAMRPFYDARLRWIKPDSAPTAPPIPAASSSASAQSTATRQTSTATSSTLDAAWAFVMEYLQADDSITLPLAQQRLREIVGPAADTGVWQEALAMIVGIEKGDDQGVAVAHQKLLQLRAESERLRLEPLPSAAAGAAPSQPDQASTAATATPSASAPRPEPTTLRDLYAPAGPRALGGHSLPPYNPPEKGTPEAASYSWPPKNWRVYISWYIREMAFRYELHGLDDFLRKEYPDQIAVGVSNLRRQQDICAIWASDVFVPEGANPLTLDEWSQRCTAVSAFYRIVSSWPRVLLPECPLLWETEEEFLKFERAVWRAFAQTYVDYYARFPPVPAQRPAAPWESDEVDS